MSTLGQLEQLVPPDELYHGTGDVQRNQSWSGESSESAATMSTYRPTSTPRGRWECDMANRWYSQSMPRDGP